MKNRYYTPKLEELNIGQEIEYYENGFSYEVKHIEKDNYEIIGEPKQVSFWEEKIFNDLSFTYIENGEDVRSNLEYFIEKKHIRIKYLDEIDLEELNWKYINKFKGSEIYEYKEESITKEKYILYKKDNIISISNNHDGYIVTMIAINNKHEFKELLNKLNIK